MSKRWLGLLAVILMGMAFPRAAWTEPGSRQALARDPEVAAAIQVLDAWIAAGVAQREQPGLSIGIVYDQDLIWARGYGFADLAGKVPATPSTLYRIASISKLFTATAIMQLRDAGRLRLDDPVAQHLAWFKVRSASAGASTITIRHLLTHTSGLPRETMGLNWSDLRFPGREEMIRNLPEQEAVFPAETVWKYSNLAVSLAGELVAAVSGEPWPQYIENHILKPLGMKGTRAEPRADTPGLATGYQRRVPGAPRELERFVDIGAEMPAGNLASSVEDLAKFASLQLRDGPAGGAQILSGSTLREMHRVHWLQPDWRSGWGLGWAVRRVGEQVRVGHGGGLPGATTRIDIAPDDKLAVIVLTNANDGDPQRYVDQAFTLVGPAIARATARPRELRSPDSALERYVGTYTWKHSDVQVMVLNGDLTLIVPDAENPWESRATLTPLGEHTFRLSTAALTYAAAGEAVTFTLDATGRAVRLSTPYQYWVRK
jgi:CubicO group peptidase (beta-lactamase class C family)